MKIRSYPKKLIANIVVSLGNHYGLQSSHSEIVYNETHYNSFVKFWGDKKYVITEGRPAWRDLKDKNLLLKIWYYVPTWIIVPLSTAIGFGLNHFKELYEVLSQLIKKI